MSKRSSPSFTPVAPAGFLITQGIDGGPYIMITRVEPPTGSRGVHHPEPGASRETIQRAIDVLAERVVVGDARAAHRRAVRDMVVDNMVLQGIDRADALVEWKRQRREAATDKIMEAKRLAAIQDEARRGKRRG
jgi:hypothetical protein